MDGHEAVVDEGAAWRCRWFLMCTGEAVSSVVDPILGDVPVCARCQVLASDAGRVPVRDWVRRGHGEGV